MTSAPVYDDAVGWVRVENLIDEQRAAGLAARCRALADGLADPRAGDKPAGGTRRLTALDERLPETAELVAALEPVVAQILGSDRHVGEVAYRSPGPGHGTQKLHADDVPRLEPGPHRAATAVVALVDFSADNGATVVVPGSHRRPDLQRRSGQLASHPDEVHLVGPAGTGFVFTGHLLHGGTGNRSAGERPALHISWRTGGFRPGQPG